MSKEKTKLPSVPSRKLCSHGLIQQLFEQAKKVADGGDRSVLRATIRLLEKSIDYRETEVGQAVIQKARDLHIDSECNIDIDDATLVYHNDGTVEGDCGYWVMGWLWVSNEDLKDN